MDKIVDATYDGVVLRPDEPLNLSANTRVEIHIEDEKDETDTPKKLKLVEMPKKKKGKPYSSLEYMASLNLDGPEDFSRNIDEYLYGGKPLAD